MLILKTTKCQRESCERNFSTRPAPHLEEFSRSMPWTLCPSIDVSAVAVGIEEDHQAHDLGDPPHSNADKLTSAEKIFVGMFMLLMLIPYLFSSLFQSFTKARRAPYAVI